MRRNTAAALAIFALAASLPSAARAQRVENPWMLEWNGGFVAVSGDFGDKVSSAGAMGGLVGYGIVPRLSIMADVSVAWFGPQEEGIPDVTTLSYFGMLGFNVTNPASRADLLLVAGAGGVSFFETVAEEGAAQDLASESYFAVNGGVKFMYNFTPKVAGTINLVAALAFTDEVVGGDKTWFLPVIAGVTFRL